MLFLEGYTSNTPFQHLVTGHVTKEAHQGAVADSSGTGKISLTHKSLSWPAEVEQAVKTNGKLDMVIKLYIDI